MEKILVIGASGGLGRGVISVLKKEFKIVGTYATSEFNCDGMQTVALDITDKQSFIRLDRDFDAVILLAGAMPAMMEGYTPQHYIDVNISGMLNVLEFCLETEIKKIIYVTTFSDSAGSFYNGVPIEDDGKRTLNYTGDHAIYAISKVAACELIEHYHQEYGLQTIIFRIPTVYCNDEIFSYFVDGNLRLKAYVKMIQDIVNDKKIEVWGDRKHAKDMPYIKDFSRLIGKAILNNDAQGVFNAGTGVPVSLDEFVDALINVFSPDTEVEKIFRPERFSQPNFTFDMSKTKATFNFVPEYSVEDMLFEIRDTLGIEKFNR